MFLVGQQWPPHTEDCESRCRLVHEAGCLGSACLAPEAQRTPGLMVFNLCEATEGVGSNAGKGQVNFQ